MSSLPSLSGVALVTGAASGMGKETAWAFAEAGCRVVVFADINAEGAKVAAEESHEFATNPSYKSTSVLVDVASADSAKRMVDETVREYGRIDYFVNAAGVRNLSPYPITDLDLDHMDTVVDVNLKGTIVCLRAVSAAMKVQEPTTYIPTTARTKRHAERSLGRGCIVTISSANGVAPAHGSASYVAAKHGVIGATKVAALDLAPYGIRVNAVLPGTVDTPMIHDLFQQIPDLKPMFEQMVPLGHRIATPDEIADAVVFLCGPSMTYATGSGFLIDAGLCLSSARLL